MPSDPNSSCNCNSNLPVALTVDSNVSLPAGYSRPDPSFRSLLEQILCLTRDIHGTLVRLDAALHSDEGSDEEALEEAPTQRIEELV